MRHYSIFVCIGFASISLMFVLSLHLCLNLRYYPVWDSEDGSNYCVNDGRPPGCEFLYYLCETVSQKALGHGTHSFLSLLYRYDGISRSMDASDSAAVLLG